MTENNLNYKKAISLPKILITLFLLIGTISSGYVFFTSRNGEDIPEEQTQAKQVETIRLAAGGEASSYLEAPGAVRAETKIDIPAMAGGTIRGVYFKTGDNVVRNQLLATIYDSAVMANLNMAQTNVSNLRTNTLTTERIADETVRQAEIGVQSAREQVEAAQIAVNTVQDNYNIAKSLQEKSGIDLKNNSINSFNGYLNMMFSTLNEIDSIFVIDGNYRYPGIDDNILGAKDPSTIQTAHSAYRQAKKTYDSLNNAEISPTNITTSMKNLSEGLGQTKTALDAAIIVLENTITSEASFPSSSLTTLKNNFISLRSSVVSSKNAAEISWQSLENQSLQNDRELLPLENALASAKNQLNMAVTGLSNARAGVESASRARDQQVLAAKTSLDSAQGQLRISSLQAADLSIKAPISGKITAKNVEIGTEVNPGQKIGEISQIDLLVIDIDLPTERVNGLVIGQNAIINPGAGDLNGTIFNIFPAADPVSRKVRVEIAYNNSGKELIAGSFAQVRIPLVEESDLGRYLIPLKALTITPDEKYIFIAENGLAKKVNVETGEAKGDEIEIISGLELGMEVIVNGAKSINEGDEIEVM